MKWFDVESYEEQEHIQIMLNVWAHVSTSAISCSSWPQPHVRETDQYKNIINKSLQKKTQHDWWITKVIGFTHRVPLDVFTGFISPVEATTDSRPSTAFPDTSLAPATAVSLTRFACSVVFWATGGHETVPFLIIILTYLYATFHIFTTQLKALYSMCK